jgi:uncharacterized protein (DUF2141 family)
MKAKKHIAIVMAGLAVSFSSFSQSTLEVTVQNIKATQGTIRVGLFKNEETFLKNAVEGKIVKASGSEVTVKFENLKSGEYAVSVIHDENENGQLDKNAMGIPKEGFAFGNNAMGMFGPPSFEEAKVIIKENSRATQSIKLKYF